MNDKELVDKLKPLKNRMIQFAASGGRILTANYVQLMKDVYLESQIRILNQLPRTFNASCSSCIKNTFEIYSSWYFKTKGELEKRS